VTQNFIITTMPAGVWCKYEHPDISFTKINTIKH